jgi:hypothetical protein
MNPCQENPKSEIRKSIEFRFSRFGFLARFPTSLSGCLVLALAGYLIAIACVRWSNGQTTTFVKPSAPNIAYETDTVWSNRYSLRFCWLCSTQSGAGPWFACSDTQTISRTSLTQRVHTLTILNLPANPPRAFWRQQIFQ